MPFQASFFFAIAIWTGRCQEAISNREVHAIIVSPEDGSVIKPGTHVPISYKVSSWVERQPMKGACISASLIDESEMEPQPPAQTCVEGIDQFAMTPHIEGSYEIAVTVWASDGVEAIRYETKPHRVHINSTAELDGAAYGRKEGFRMVGIPALPTLRGSRRF